VWLSAAVGVLPRLRHLRCRRCLLSGCAGGLSALPGLCAEGREAVQPGRRCAVCVAAHLPRRGQKNICIQDLGRQSGQAVGGGRAIRADPPRQAAEELFISEIRSALTEQILKGSLLWKLLEVDANQKRFNYVLFFEKRLNKRP